MEESKKRKLHAICIAFPIQGHITPMLQFAKLLNSKGFHITFFNTHHTHNCLLKSNPTTLDGSPSFRFVSFPDGLPPSENDDLPRHMPSLLNSLGKNCLQPFVKVLREINDPASGSPPIDVIISDAIIPFAVNACRELLLDCPVVYFTPASPSSFVAYSQYDSLLQRGTLPFKDPEFMTNGSLDVELDSIPPSMKGMRLRNLSSHVRTTDKDNPAFDYIKRLIERCSLRPIIFNTFEALDHESLMDLSNIMVRPLFTVGPLNAISQSLGVASKFGSTFWKEDTNCHEWLNSQKPNSVVYASFGSTTMITFEQVIEFAWGIANSKHPFLWVIRPDMIIGKNAILSVEFEKEVKGRGLIVSWCPQEKVLSHSSIGVFLTHCGWNSILETITGGVSVICWPPNGDHQSFSWWCCNKWEIGLELGINVDRDQVTKRIREVLEGEEGEEMKKKVMEWKMRAEEAITLNGSSSLVIDKFVNYVLSLKSNEVVQSRLT